MKDKNLELSDFWANYKSYHMQISGFRDGDGDHPPQTRLLFHSSDIAFNLFFSISEHIREEAVDITGLEDEPTDFDKISTFFFQRYKLTDFDDSGSLESAILQHIEKLKKYDFTLLLNFIHNEFMALRKEKIDFWEKILEKYELSKDKLDKGVLTILGEFDSDLECLTKELPDNLKEFNRLKK